MAGILDSFRRTWAKLRLQQPGSQDRNWRRAEAERHLQARNYPEAEFHLAVAVEEADRRNVPLAQRIRLRLDLVEVKRRRAAPPGGSGPPDRRRLEEAELIARRAMEMALAESHSEDYVLALDALTDLLYDQARWQDLEKALQEAIRLGAALPRPDPLRMARRVHRLGVARYHNGNSEGAIPALEKSIQLHEQAYGPGSVATANLLSDVGRILRTRGELDRAREYLERALRVHAAEYGPDSAQAFVDLQQLAGVLEDAGDWEGAAAQYERVLLMKLRRAGLEGLEEAAELQYSLASLHISWGNLSRARELLSQAIQAFRARGGPRLAVAHEMLGQVEERSGRFHSSVREMEQAAQVWEKCGRSKMPELLRNLEYRADLLEQMRKPREAAWVRERIAELRSSRAQPA
jgi:tetratricopeptide (TPR) repeat protein